MISETPDQEKGKEDFKYCDKLRENEELAERFSLIIKLNHRGSLTSLDKMQSSRRNSSNFELNSRQSMSKLKIVTVEGSASAIDLLKTNLEMSNSIYKLSQSSFLYCKTTVPHFHKYNKVCLKCLHLLKYK